MNTKKQHKKFDEEQIGKDFFSSRSIDFPGTKEDAWNNIESKLPELSAQKAGSRFLSTRILAMAAAIAVLAVIAASLRFYTSSFQANNESLAVLLPDSSQIILEKGSSLSYQPIWYRNKRTLKFEGIASFSVAEGKRFKVISDAGITEVLGTTFKIESGEAEYRVACYSGSVKVSDPITSVSAILTANEKAILKSPGVFDIQLIKTEKDLQPRPLEYISFRKEPVRHVFDSIEDIFGVEIEVVGEADFLYTGNFKSEMELDEVLPVVCLALGLEYEETSPGKYSVWARDAVE